ncbi:MAG TPA: hypothetical protein VD833_00175 [Vicinamibacterales bacterium]|nr:hypothetical protein [Vicinamibacterales bacterium]
MTESASLSRSACRGLALALCIALAPVPVLAGERPRPAPSDPPKLAAAMSKVVDRDLAARPTRVTETRRTARQQSNPAADSPAFFKTKTGILVLAVMAVGTGYAIYSTQNDRITSPGKE